jgi:serine/threonine protein kinase
MDDYTVIKTLGSGSFGEVMLAQNHDDDKLYAIKSIAKDKKQRRNIEREIKAGNRLDHPNIASFICHEEDDHFDYLVFDYVPGCDMFALLEQREFKPLSESECREIMKQLVSALLHTHERGVVHLDLKLDSIFLCTFEIVLEVPC